LPYVGGRLAFDILLPAPGAMAALIGRLRHEGAAALLAGLRPQEVALSLPKLRLRTHVELSAPLQSLGVSDAFSPARADLSGIAGAPGDLFVSAVEHEAFIRVDESGTEAAAATGVAIATAEIMRPQIAFDVDRPFVFLVRDTETGTILFAGEDASGSGG
jgi:serpin B